MQIFIYLVFYFLLSFSVVAQEVNVPIDLNVPNGCLINAIACEDCLKSYNGKAELSALKDLTQNSNRWARVMIVSFKDGMKIKNHALCVFDYSDSLWIYDSNFGTYKIQEPIERTAFEIAQKWQTTRTLISAQFVDIVENTNSAAGSR